MLSIYNLLCYILIKYIVEKCKLLPDKDLINFMLSNKRVYTICEHVLQARKKQHYEWSKTFNYASLILNFV